jgi:alcohol dehydrogenase
MTAQQHPLEMLRYPIPTLEPGALLVRVDCCTICGSDIHSWSGRRSSPVPVILGHEIVGSIIALGDGVQSDAGDRPLAPGDRITWTIADNCGRCSYCREKHLPMKCHRLKKYGHDSCKNSPHLVGGFAEVCYIGPGTGIVKIPDEVPDTVAAPANCALATVVAGWEAGRVRAFENVLIQGAGALGIYAAALASHYGCRSIIVADVQEPRLEFARAFGATHTINTGQMTTDEFVDTVRELTGGFGVDCAMEVAGVPELIPVGLACLRTGGRYVELGNSFPGAIFSYDASDIIWRRLTICGVHNYDTAHLQQAVDFLAAAAFKFPFETIVTHRYPLEKVNEAMKAAASGVSLRVAVTPE